jgi:hypothetical protein
MHRHPGVCASKVAAIVLAMSSLSRQIEPPGGTLVDNAALGHVL